MHVKLRIVAPHEFQVLSVMPVSGLASFDTMMLALVREWIWDVLERGLEAAGLLYDFNYILFMISMCQSYTPVTAI